MQIDFGDAKKESEPPLDDEVEQEEEKKDENGEPDFAADMEEEFKDVEIERRGTLVGTLNYMAPEMLDHW